MLLLLPLGAEARGVRAAGATLALVAVNTLVFFWTAAVLSAPAVDDGEIGRVAEWTLRLASQQAPALANRAAGYDSPLVFLDRDPGWREDVRSPELRERLEGCLHDARRLWDRHPFYAHGFVPAEVSPHRLLSHQFLHADFLHLGFNMLFLWAVGATLEVTLGAAVFLPAYLLCGIAAALVHASLHAGSTEPVIGASGAVAGAMGMFAALHGTERVRLAVVAALAVAPRILFVAWPAWVFLALWLLEQLFFASFGLDSLGIAFSAHLGGFAAGVLIGAIVRLLGLGRA